MANPHQTTATPASKNTQHTTHNKNNIKHDTMVPCCPPPSSGFNIKSKSNRIAQHGDIFLNRKITLFFILLNIIMQAGDRCTSKQKVIKSMCTNPSYPPIIFQKHCPFFIMFWLGFGWEGGSPWSPCFQHSCAQVSLSQLQQSSSLDIVVKINTYENINC